MKEFVAVLLAAMLMAGPGLADDHAEEGKEVFNKSCKACHSVTAGDGTVLFKGGKTGPDLFNVFGRTFGSVEGYRYSADMLAAGAAAQVWTPEVFETYIARPREMFPKTKMGFAGLKDEEDRAELAAYLLSVSPDYVPAP